MTVTASPQYDEAVLVGATRGEAAEMFGSLCDHAFLTSYDDFDAETDILPAAYVGLVAGEALAEVLPHIIAASERPGSQRPAVVIGVSPDLHGLESAEKALARFPSLAVAEVVADDRRVLLRLAPADRVTPSADTRVVEAVAALRRRAQNAPSPRRAGAGTAATGAAPAESPSPGRAPDRRRRLLLAAGGVLLAALVTAAVGTVVTAALGDSALLVLLLVVVVVGLLGLAGLQWLLLRQLRVLTREHEAMAEFRTRTDRRTTRLLELARGGRRAHEQQARALGRLSDDVDTTRERLMALGRLVTRQRL